jgi:phosphoribosylformylglycinamidine synthase subunit PurQ / glutaminase
LEKGVPMKKAHFLILSGDGINCERETSWALELAGAQTTVMPINHLLTIPHKLSSFDGLALPGGFSFGDELGSGQVLAIKLKHGLGDEFSRFLEERKPIIGICNGFQALMKLGVLPDYKKARTGALAPNECGHFQDRWVNLKVHPTVCKWALNFRQEPDEEIELPIRHGEGRLIFGAGKEAEVLQELKQNHQIVLSYSEDVNGSTERIAGICDPTGTILGLMPHPEAYLFKATAPRKEKDPHAKAAGSVFFESILTYLKQN